MDAGEQMVRRRVVVSGRVQGVGYRASTVAAAKRTSVAGWVRNRDDGGVEAEIEGPPDAVDAMLAWMRRGPAWAHVDEIDVSELAPLGEHRFTVR